MQMIRCANGHYFDADKFSSCPICNPQKADELIPAYCGDEPYIFISYAHSDTTRVMQFINELKDTHRFWYDEGIPSGSEWVSTIAERIKNCSVFLLFVSQASIESKNVRNEISYATNYVEKILAVHLEQVTLPAELDFMLGRFQYVKLSEIGYEPGIKKIRESLPQSTQITDAPDKVPEETDGSETDENKESFSDCYDIKGVQSRGHTGEVLFVRQRRTGAGYIAKHRIFGDKNIAIIRAAARNELRNLLRLQGKPYTPEIVDFFENEKESYVVISRIHGYALEKILKDYASMITLECAVSLIYETALVLHDMHRMELVYCDLKPSNIMLDQYGRINLIDFDNTSSIHDKNSIPMATKKYAAPEQLSMDYAVPDIRFDVYSLGVLLKELLAYNKPPVFVPGLNPKNSDPRLLAYINEIQRKMTHPQPGNRYGSMGEVVAVLSLLINWNPEESLRELALTAIPRDISLEDEVQNATPVPDTDTDSGPAFIPSPVNLPLVSAPLASAPLADYATTEFLTFSTDYHL